MNEYQPIEMRGKYNNAYKIVMSKVKHQKAPIEYIWSC